MNEKMSAPILQRNGNYINRKHTKKLNEEGLRNEWKVGGGVKSISKKTYTVKK